MNTQYFPPNEGRSGTAQARLQNKTTTNSNELLTFYSPDVEANNHFAASNTYKYIPGILFQR